MGDSVYSGVGRIVAVGDLHGNYAGLVRILQRTGILDRKGHWAAEDTHLVQLGDILGRGGEPGKIFRLLRRLEQEAPIHNSQVHLLLGNHEAMSMSGMLMYNTVEEFKDLAEASLLEPAGDAPREDFASAPRTVDSRFGRRLDMLGCREFRESLSPEGLVGQWLATHDTALSINGCLFVHGGLNRDYGLMPLDALNDAVRRELALGAPPAQPPSQPQADWTAVGAPPEIMLHREGPQWNRDLVIRPDARKQKDLEEVLEYHGCDRMVVGHTPTTCIDPGQPGQIATLYGGRLWCVDTGIGKAYGSRLSALQIEGDFISTIYP